MRRTRAKYHNAVGRVKRDENIIVRQRFADSVPSSDNHYFWSEVKRLTGHHGAHVKVIDNKNDSNEMASLFAQKYYKLYSSVSYSASDIKAIDDELI
jgi:hypothetical protein